MPEKRIPITSWLPMSLEDASKRGWDGFDIILITGDAYVDHPSFGTAIIGRVLEAEGYRVGIISQPNWRDDLRDFQKLGLPKLFFGVTSGNMDSMVNHYTALKRLRSDDAYTAGGAAGFRPDYATVVYSQILKSLFPDIPVVIGGIEASMRRATHYDYWTDTVKPSILVDSGADLLVYGMAEKAITDLARAYKTGNAEASLINICQVAYLTREDDVEHLRRSEAVELPSHEECTKDKLIFAEAFRLIENESNRYSASTIIQKTGESYLVIKPPYPASGTDVLDKTYSLPFTRKPHPRYRKRGDVPAYNMIRHSVTIHRGCFGGCSFCTISMHQGKFISSRSEDSIENEVEAIKEMDDFKGIITDLGGPSANMYRMGGIDQSLCRKCSRSSCIWPKICKNLDFNHEHLLRLYRKVRETAGIKKVFIGSGIRYDMLTGHPPEISAEFHLNRYTNELIRFHVSGRLKVAPEHSDRKVLQLIRKPPFDSYLSFRSQFISINKKHGLKQQLIPYLISSLPGCDNKAMAQLASDIAKTGYKPEQVQDFTPTPMTLSNVIYYTGLNPYTKESIYTPVTEKAKRLQQLFLFWHKPENKALIQKTLRESGNQHFIKALFPENQGWSKRSGNRGGKKKR